MSKEDFIPTIGIECHVQLATNTKLFSSSSNDARDAEPNTTISYGDFGLPGVLPVLNKRAVELAVIAGKALNANIAKVSRFDRKHYFYPDLPKGYQTTQMYAPIILGGYVEAPLEDGKSTVKVTLDHAHLEDDAGKLTHHGDYSLVDLNRAGTPLIEIVSNPDMHSAAEAKAYATELHRLMVFSGVSWGDLYHGNMRFDVNVSVALKNAKELGIRTEIKNLNSFRSIERATQYEINRQIKLIEQGGVVAQETRGWDEAKQKTVSQRTKSDAQDYRYMPDPDIPPIVLTDEEITAMQASMPELPAYYRDRWIDLELDHSVINRVLESPAVADTLDAIVDRCGAGDLARRAFNWFASMQAEDIDVTAVESGLVGPRRLSELSQMVGDNKLSSTGAKEVFLALFDKKSIGKSSSQIATELNLIQVSDSGELEAIVSEVLASPASQQSIKDIKEGKVKAIGYLVGQVMKASKGKANPAMVQTIIKEKINEI